LLCVGGAFAQLNGDSQSDFPSTNTGKALARIQKSQQAQDALSTLLRRADNDVENTNKRLGAAMAAVQTLKDLIKSRLKIFDTTDLAISEAIYHDPSRTAEIWQTAQVNLVYSTQQIPAVLRNVSTFLSGVAPFLSYPPLHPRAPGQWAQAAEVSAKTAAFVQTRLLQSICRETQCAPCQNSALCMVLPGHDQYQCVCAPGFNGTFCDNNIDDCKPNPCMNGAKCTDGQNSYKCTCKDGFKGKRCQINIDDCVNQPCLNGGSCVDGINTYTCKCIPGFEGPQCGTDIDECMSGPCQNGGKCIDRVNSYLCKCQPGFVGPKCQVDVDDCKSNPCKNNGMCIDQVNGYQCKCNGGWGGDKCTVNIDDCKSNPCKNNGTCTDLLDAYKCRCKKGWTGVDCGSDVNECFSSPCKNGGTCLDKPGAYKCMCPPGFEGKRCGREILPCKDSPCKNGGKCDDQGAGKFKCLCPPGFEGRRCGKRIDFCLSSPCKRDSTCVPIVNGFSCKCRPGFSGTTCDKDIDDCGGKPCQNGGSCTDLVNDYKCSCVSGFRGKMCEEGVQCPKLNSTAASSVVYTNGARFPSTATFTCNNGFSTEDNLARTCQADGTWSLQDPRCLGKECPLLSPVPNGMVSFTNDRRFPSLATYACKPGYTTFDPISRKCTRTGRWKGQEPICVGVMCKALLAPKNGMVVTSNNNRYPALATYSCQPGYATADTTQRACQEDGSWNGKRPACLPIDCSLLSSRIPFGSVNVTNKGKFPAMAVYECDKGYQTQDPTVRRCKPDSMWAGRAPRCEGVPCNTLNNGKRYTVQVTNAGKYPSVASYQCNNGYQTQDKTLRKCTVSGSWDGSKPQCQGIPCAALPAMPNGAVTSTNDGRFPSRASYQCNTGFVLSDSRPRVCQPDGSWTLQTPRCNGRQCAAIKPIDNGRFTVSNSNEYPAVVTYKCDPGYTSTDPMTRACKADGTWSGTPPVCKGIRCSDPPPFRRGTVTVSNEGVYPSEARYACNNGFSTTDFTVRKCAPDGSWADKAPTCLGAKCAPIPPVMFGSISYTNDARYPSKAEISCDPGYYPDDGSSSSARSFVRRCGPDGTWGGRDVKCKGRKCDALPNIPFGTVSASNDGRFPSTATYTCNGGYATQDPTSRTCMTDGTWSGKQPTCGGATCQVLPAFSNGQVSYSNNGKYPSTATYQCAPGYVSDNAMTRNCDEAGNWQGKEPVCAGLKCAVLAKPALGSVTVSNQGKFPAEASYKCDDGAKLQGATIRSCRPDGSWSSAEPVCAGNPCAATPPFLNGRVDKSNNGAFPSTATYTCLPGYVMTGAASATCKADGSWSSPPPACNGLTCNILPPVLYGKTDVSNGGKFPAKAVFTCDKGYMLWPPMEGRYCKADADWTDAQPECVMQPKLCLLVSAGLYTATLNGTEYTQASPHPVFAHATGLVSNNKPGADHGQAFVVNNGVVSRIDTWGTAGDIKMPTVVEIAKEVGNTTGVAAWGTDFFVPVGHTGSAGSLRKYAAAVAAGGAGADLDVNAAGDNTAQPNSVAVDQARGVVFFTNAGEGKSAGVWRMDATGANKAQVYQGFKGLVGIALTATDMFFVDAASMSVYKAPIGGVKKPEAVVTSVVGLQHVFVEEKYYKLLFYTTFNAGVGEVFQCSLVAAPMQPTCKRVVTATSPISGSICNVKP